MSKYWGCLLFVLVLLSGCNRKLSDIFDRNTGRLMVRDVTFEQLSAKAKIDFDSKESGLSGTANIRIRRDSIIWVSLSPGLGIEAARVLITNDSIFVLDKVHKEYQQIGLNELSERFDFDINFQLIQAVVLGNLIYPYDREKVVRSASGFTYNQQQGSFYFENIIGAKTMKLEKLQVTDTVSENTFSVNYREFQLVEEQILPFEIAAELRYKDRSKDPTRIDIEYKQAQIEKKPLKFPFNIPQKYERK